MLPSWANDTVTRIRAGTIEERGTIYPDWTNPDSMEDPIPVLIDMSQSDIFMKIYDKHLDDEICWGFTCTIPHKDTAVEFLKHVMPEQ